MFFSAFHNYRTGTPIVATGGRKAHHDQINRAGKNAGLQTHHLDPFAFDEEGAEDGTNPPTSQRHIQTFAGKFQRSDGIYLQNAQHYN